MPRPSFLFSSRPALLFYKSGMIKLYWDINKMMCVNHLTQDLHGKQNSNMAPINPTSVVWFLLFSVGYLFIWWYITAPIMSNYMTKRFSCYNWGIRYFDSCTWTHVTRIQLNLINWIETEYLGGPNQIRWWIKIRRPF